QGGTGARSVDLNLRMMMMRGGGRWAHYYGGDGGVAVPVAVTRDGRVLAEVTTANKVQLWDTATGKALREFECKQPTGHPLACAPSGKFLAAGDAEEGEGVVRVWEVATGKALRLLKVGKGRVTHNLTFAPDGLSLAGAVGNEVRVWELATGKRLRLYQGHE